MNGHPSTNYNLGSGNGYSVKEVIDTALKVTGKPIQVIESKKRPGDPAVLVASSDKIKKELDWNPKHADLEGLIASAWKWHQIETESKIEDWRPAGPPNIRERWTA